MDNILQRWCPIISVQLPSLMCDSESDESAEFESRWPKHSRAMAFQSFKPRAKNAGREMAAVMKSFTTSEERVKVEIHDL